MTEYENVRLKIELMIEIILWICSTSYEEKYWYLINYKHP